MSWRDVGGRTGKKEEAERLLFISSPAMMTPMVARIFSPAHFEATMKFHAGNFFLC